MVKFSGLKTRRYRHVYVLLVYLFVMFLWGHWVASSAAADEGDLCLPVHTKITTTVVTEGCNSPVGICTEGEISSGVLKGFTSFTALDLEFSAGLEGTENRIRHGPMQGYWKLKQEKEP